MIQLPEISLDLQFSSEYQETHLFGFRETEGSYVFCKRILQFD